MMRGSNYIKHKEKMILSKYTIRTEAETIFTDKVKMLEKSDMNITYICGGKPYPLPHLKW